MKKLSDRLSELPEYHLNPLFRTICEIYVDADRARLVTNAEASFYMGVVLGALLAKQEELDRYQKAN